MQIVASVSNNESGFPNDIETKIRWLIAYCFVVSIVKSFKKVGKRYTQKIEYLIVHLLIA